MPVCARLAGDTSIVLIAVQRLPVMSNSFMKRPTSPGRRCCGAAVIEGCCRVATAPLARCLRGNVATSMYAPLDPVLSSWSRRVGGSCAHSNGNVATRMPDSPPDHKWYLRHRTWLILSGTVVAIYTFVAQFHLIEPNAKRIAEIARFYKPTPPPPPPAPKVAEAPKPPPAPPPKPTVAPLRNANDIRDTFRGLAGDSNKWAPVFDAHMKNRETAFVLELTEIENADGGRFKFEGDHTHENWRPTFYVLPRNRADLKRFKPGMRLLIEGDLDRYVDTAAGHPDIIFIVRARISEAKEADGVTTSSIKP